MMETSLIITKERCCNDVGVMILDDLTLGEHNKEMVISVKIIG